MNATQIKEIITSLASLSTFRRVIIVVLVSLAVVCALFGCTSMRSTSVRVDKAEKVDINVTDSIAGSLPMF